jgi:hypothetical protein
LRHLLTSFGTLYLNPSSARAIGRSPLHLLCAAWAFIVLRLLAVGNNVLIVLGVAAPIGAPIEAIARISSPVAGFVLVIVPLFHLVIAAVLPLCTTLIRGWCAAAPRSDIARART